LFKDWFVFLAEGLCLGANGGPAGAPDRKCLSSLSLDVWSSKLTCYPCAEDVRHTMLYAIWSSKRGTE
jgi:hypothetical protein